MPTSAAKDPKRTWLVLRIREDLADQTELFIHAMIARKDSTMNRKDMVKAGTGNSPVDHLSAAGRLSGLGSQAMTNAD